MSRDSSSNVVVLRQKAASPARVRSLAARLGDADLVAAIQRGDDTARAELFDRHAGTVRRVLARVLGADQDLPDALQDVFLHAFANLENLREPARVKHWLVGIAVYVARGIIRKRTRSRWLRFLPPESLPEQREAPTDHAGSEQLRAVYAALDRMPADERIAFALRFIDGMELKTVAESCGVSLATIKRRLQRAEAQFRKHAAALPALAERLGDVAQEEGA